MSLFVGFVIGVLAALYVAGMFVAALVIIQDSSEVHDEDTGGFSFYALSVFFVMFWPFVVVWYWIVDSF